jgi:ABC-type uncharacterized transport system ATPase subunit
VPPCFDVSFQVPAGASYVLVGRAGAGKAAVRGCLRGDLRPKEGRVAVFGLDPRRERREIARRIRSGELVVSEERFEPIPGSPAATVVATVSDPVLAALADRVGFLSEGRLVLDDAVAALTARFRRLRYVNEITENRTEYGTELDEFDAVKVKVRGWGVEAVVSNFDDVLIERLRATEGVSGLRVSSMSLDEIFRAVVGEP